MIYVSEHHDEVLAHWRREGLERLSLDHVDFHDDLRGLLVDRVRGVAYPIGAMARGEAPLDAGNFLAHAVVEGRVRSIRWVHGRVGGRAWDAGIVRYESDLFALHHRWRQRIRPAEEVPLDFRELRLEEWNGPREDGVLSIDWDCFASILQEAEGIERRVAEFLERLGQSVPRHTWLVYSPEYCHPSLEAFGELAESLARRFAQSVEWRSEGLRRGELHPTGVSAELPGNFLMRIVLALRRRGVF